MKEYHEKRVLPDNDELRERITKLLSQTGVSVGGTLIGLAIGGPVGAITGAAIKPATMALSELIQESLQQRRDRAESVLMKAAELRKEDVSILEDNLISTAEKLDLAVRILSAAADTPLADKISAYSKLLALGANPDVEKGNLVNEYILVVQALTALSMTHLRVLAVISSSKEDQDDPKTGLTPFEIANKVGAPPEKLRPLVRMLELYGLITDVSHRSPKLQGTVHWQITDLGLLCMKVLTT